MTHCCTLLTLFTAIFVIAICNSATHLALLSKEKFGQALNSESGLSQSVYMSVCLCTCLSVLKGLCLPLIWCAWPSHHFEVTAKWPVALGTGHLANSLCVFASQCLIDTKWYRAGAHQRWPSQLTETVIYSFTEQYLHSTLYAHTHTKSPKSTLSPLSFPSGFSLLPLHSLRAPTPRFQTPWRAAWRRQLSMGNVPTGPGGGEGWGAGGGGGGG